MIGGFTNGIRTDGIGALLLGYYDDKKKLIYAGRTGTGFTQANSRKLRKQLEEMRRDGMPFVAVPDAAGKGALWVRPELSRKFNSAPGQRITSCGKPASRVCGKTKNRLKCTGDKDASLSHSA